MVAPAAEPSSATIPSSVGRETAGQIVPRRGSTSTAYTTAGAALVYGDRMIRSVQRRRGRRIIRAQKGKIIRPLNLKMASMLPRPRMLADGFNFLVLPARFRVAESGRRLPLVSSRFP